MTHLCTLLNTLADNVDSTLKGGRRDHGSDVGARLVACSLNKYHPFIFIRNSTQTGVDLQFAAELDQIGDPVLCLADKHSRRECHAALASGTECSTDQLVQRGRLVGIGHHNTVVLGSHVRLQSVT